MYLQLIVVVDDENAERLLGFLRTSATKTDAASLAELARRNGIHYGVQDVGPVKDTKELARQFLSPVPQPGTYTFLGGKIVVTVEEGGKGAVTWDIPRPACPSCGEIQCCFMCDGSVSNMGPADVECEEEEDVLNRLLCNGALDGIQTLIHCLVVTGAIKSEDPLVNAALEMALTSVSMQ